MPKYLFYYQKGEPVRWLGHLDILRAFERALRRAAVPVSFSLGFNPRVRINFASPLGTGITGDAEPTVVELDEALEADILISRLNEVLPPGIRVRDCSLIPDAGRRDLLNSYDRAEYLITCSGDRFLATEQGNRAVADLLAKDHLPVTREREGRSRAVDIRPSLFELSFVDCDQDTLRSRWRTVVGQGEAGNVKPAELIQALAEHCAGLKIRRAHRVRLISNYGAGQSE